MDSTRVIGRDRLEVLRFLVVGSGDWRAYALKEYY